MKLILAALLLTACGHQVTYDLPGGITCTVLDTSQGFEKFTGCSNGATITNPPSYSIERN